MVSSSDLVTKFGEAHGSCVHPGLSSTAAGSTLGSTSASVNQRERQESRGLFSQVRVNILIKNIGTFFCLSLFLSAATLVTFTQTPKSAV